MRNAIVIIYSRGALQPSGIRRFGNGVRQLSSLRPVLSIGGPLTEFLRDALAFERSGEFNNRHFRVICCCFSAIGYCCMGANRGASRLSPSLACATGITSAYVKCAG